MNYLIFLSVIVSVTVDIIDIKSTRAINNTSTNLIEVLLGLKPIAPLDVDCTSNSCLLDLGSLLEINKSHSKSKSWHLLHDGKWVSEAISNTDTLERNLGSVFGFLIILNNGLGDCGNVFSCIWFTE